MDIFSSLFLPQLSRVKNGPQMLGSLWNQCRLLMLWEYGQTFGFIDWLKQSWCFIGTLFNFHHLGLYLECLKCILNHLTFSQFRYIFKMKNAVLQMLETWLSKERLLSKHSTPRFLTDDEESREQPSSLRQCSRLLLVWFLGPIINTFIFINMDIKITNNEDFICAQH